MAAHAAVRIRGYFRYDSGSPYRVWTLTRDIPELRLNGAWREDVGGPDHAVAGDELWEDREDRGQVFRLKRDDMVVARPEWWQVRDVVFGGEPLPSWTPGGRPGARRAPGLRLIATPSWGRRPAAFDIVWLATETNEEGGLQAGDRLIENRRANGTVYMAQIQRGGETVRTLEPEEIADLIGHAFSNRQMGRIQSKSKDGDVIWAIAEGRGVAHDQTNARFFRGVDGRWSWHMQEVARHGQTWEDVFDNNGEAASLLHNEQVRSAPDLEGTRRVVGTAQVSAGLLHRPAPLATVSALAGDVIVVHDDLGGLPLEGVRGVRHPLTADDYECLRAILDDAGGLREAHQWIEDITPGAYYGVGERVAAFIGDRRKWKLRRKVWHSCLTLVRPVTQESGSMPVEATTDAGALFELVAQCGGRLQSGKEA